MAYHLCKSLATLRSQVKSQWPKRSINSDGWIGDAAHRNRKSDHNPNTHGAVCAIDLTNDPANGFHAKALGDAILASQDPRVNYLIFNKKIAFMHGGQGIAPRTWGPYSRAASMPHDQHIHISVKQDAKYYDDAKPWAVGKSPPAAETKPPPVVSTRQDMARIILGYEALRDKQGHLVVYKASDGGLEIGGIVQKHHPEQFKKILGYLKSKQWALAERECQNYVIQYTNIAATWTADLMLEFFLRDCVFNRGVSGGARILQRAAKTKDDTVVGPVTKAAMQKFTADQLLVALRAAREKYERDVLHRNESSPLWKGLVNRWNKVERDAKTFKAPVIPPEIGAGGGAVVVGGGWAIWAWLAGVDWVTVGCVAVGSALLGAVLYGAIHKYRRH